MSPAKCSLRGHAAHSARCLRNFYVFCAMPWVEKSAHVDSKWWPARDFSEMLPQWFLKQCTIYICHYMVLLTPLGPQHHYCICSMSTCPGKDPIQSGWHQISFPQSDSIRLCLCISANLALLECVKPQHQHSTQSHLRLQTVNSPHMANPCLLLQFPNANSSWIMIPATKKQTF